MKNSKIKINKNYEYNIEPTKLTKQIEEITNYRIRKQNLEDEIKRIKNSNDSNKEKKNTTNKNDDLPKYLLNYTTLVPSGVRCRHVFNVR